MRTRLTVVYGKRIAHDSGLLQASLRAQNYPLISSLMERSSPPSALRGALEGVASSAGRAADLWPGGAGVAFTCRQV
jgi:hypothetical protein